MKTQLKSRFALAFTILTLASLACSIALFSTPTPVPTNTPSPTATLSPSPTAPPVLEPAPQSGLTIMACAPDSDVECPQESVEILDFFPDQTLEYETEYSLTISAGTQILFYVGWCVLYEDLLQPNLDNMKFVFDIAGEPFVHLLKGNYFTSNDGSTPPNDTYCYSVSGVVSGWQAGQTLRIAFGFFILSDIDDGWDVYPPTNYTRTYLITVE